MSEQLAMATARFVAPTGGAPASRTPYPTVPSSSAYAYPPAAPATYVVAEPPPPYPYGAAAAPSQSNQYQYYAQPPPAPPSAKMMDDDAFHPVVGGGGGGGGSGSSDSAAGGAAYHARGDFAGTGDYDPEAAHAAYVGAQIGNAKNRFIFRVYCVLLMMLTLTTAMTAGFVLSDDVRRWAQSQQWLFWTSWVSTLVLMFVMFCVRKRRPWNAVLLFTWTVLFSFMVAFISSFYNAKVVLEAFAITTLVFGSLTLYVLFTKADFRFLGAALFAGLMVLMLAAIIQWVFPMGSWWNYVYCVVGSILFIGYILYDTSMLLHTYANDLDEWVMPAVALYLDFVNFFLLILRLLGGSGGRR